MSRWAVERGPQRRALGVAVWLLAWLSAAASIAVALAYRTYEVHVPFDLYGEFYLPDLVVAVVYGPVAALVLSRVQHPLGWLLASTAVGFGLTAFALQYAMLGVGSPGLPALGLVTNFVTYGWALGAFGMVLVMPWLLTHDTPTDWRATAAWAGLLLTLLVCLPRLVLQIPGAPANPLAVGPALSTALERAMTYVLVPLGVIYAFLGAAYLVRRAMSARAEERRGLGWVIAGMVLLAGSYAGFELGLRLGGPLLPVAAAGVFAGEIMLPAAILVLVLRQQLWGADVAVSRATLWGLLTALLVAAYVALVWLSGMLLPWRRETAALVAAALLALAMQPARQWLQTRVDRLVYGSGADAGHLLARLGDHTGGAGLDGLADGLRRSLRLRYVEVRSCEEEVPQVRATAGDPTERDVRIPLRNQQRTVGELRVAPRAGERLDPRTLQLLDSVTGIVAVALELAQANELLATARDRVLDVRHEERRLLRRELHDSLGPALAGIGLGLAAIDNGSDLAAGQRQLLRQLREELTARSEDVRTMAHAMLPPALDDGRLEDALQALARRFSSPAFDVRVDAAGADAIDARRQVAVYHIAGEALLNAYRHSCGTQCLVQVAVAPTGEVTVNVHDDGVGLNVEAPHGVGLSSMRERALEAGGELDVHAAEGTRVEVRLP